MNETAVRLARRGVRVLDAHVNTSGRQVFLLHSTTDGWDVPMFPSDAEDLVNDRATLEQIMERNRAEDLAEPWPAIAELLTAMTLH
jgi:hypothetical protein